MPRLIIFALIGGLILTIFMAVEVFLQGKQEPTFEDYLWNAKIYLCHDVVAIIWLGLMISVVWKISKMQMKRAEDLTKRATQY